MFQSLKATIGNPEVWKERGSHYVGLQAEPLDRAQLRGWLQDKCHWSRHMVRLESLSSFLSFFVLPFKAIKKVNSSKELAGWLLVGALNSGILVGIGAVCSSRVSS